MLSRFFLPTGEALSHSFIIVATKEKRARLGLGCPMDKIARGVVGGHMHMDRTPLHGPQHSTEGPHEQQMMPNISSMVHISMQCGVRPVAPRHACTKTSCDLSCLLTYVEWPLLTSVGCTYVQVHASVCACIRDFPGTEA